jgi:hypothetical protein
MVALLESKEHCVFLQYLIHSIHAQPVPLGGIVITSVCLNSLHHVCLFIAEDLITSSCQHWLHSSQQHAPQVSRALAHMSTNYYFMLSGILTLPGLSSRLIEVYTSFLNQTMLYH